LKRENFLPNGKYEGNHRYNGTEKSKARIPEKGSSQTEAHSSARLQQAKAEEACPWSSQALEAAMYLSPFSGAIHVTALATQ
jgi:hypothetical protein